MPDPWIAQHVGLRPSILLHVLPELVRDGCQAADWLTDDRHHLLTTGMGEYTRSGVIGRPSLGSAEKGKAALASLVESFAPCWRSCGETADLAAFYRFPRDRIRSIASAPVVMTGRNSWR